MGMDTLSSCPVSEAVPFAADSAGSEWRAVCLEHVNVLLEGTETAIDAVVGRLLPHLREPVVSIEPKAAFSLPTTEIGTLILNEVARLTIREQTQFLEWLNTASAPPQLITTSVQPLFARVERGLFGEVLYYRLNVIRLQVDCSNT
jgi:Sigma-54 interaction domain